MHKLNEENQEKVNHLSKKDRLILMNQFVLLKELKSEYYKNNYGYNYIDRCIEILKMGDTEHYNEIFQKYLLYEEEPKIKKFIKEVIEMFIDLQDFYTKKLTDKEKFKIDARKLEYNGFGKQEISYYRYTNYLMEDLDYKYRVSYSYLVEDSPMVDKYRRMLKKYREFKNLGLDMDRLKELIKLKENC